MPSVKIKFNEIESINIIDGQLQNKIKRTKRVLKVK